MVKPFTVSKRLHIPSMLARAGVQRGLVLTDACRLSAPKSLAPSVPRGLGVIVRPATDLALWQAAGRQKGWTVLTSGLHPQRGSRMPHHAREPELSGYRAAGALTAAAHSRRALYHARRSGVRMVLVSPVFPTRSHPGAMGLGVHRFSRLIRGCRLDIFALGGVTRQTSARLRQIPGLKGIAAIDGWTRRGMAARL